MIPKWKAKCRSEAHLVLRRFFIDFGVRPGLPGQDPKKSFKKHENTGFIMERIGAVSKVGKVSVTGPVAAKIVKKGAQKRQDRPKRHQKRADQGRKQQ